MTREGAWRASTYRAGPVVAWAGRRSPSADAWLAAHGARAGAIITAWNPMCRWHPRGWNDRAQERLRAATRRWARAEGFSGTKRWQEHNLLLAANPRAVTVLARRFRQAAILVLRKGQPARLRVCA
ncbi:DUF3293 domain-containing protein [Roseococcus suduntuyensis]|uniref:DUF3293 domain-containing protein n=1 Tax=Roseococcus suduntuyensis TaxID=455361 RepID=A0A840AD37_9PROT|nr:DUF3293 domain-containing protein [Roseococcus suduntuyensis]MBB3898260.1 hypothetical protein [Roseococcus suduntuyensis]